VRITEAHLRRVARRFDDGLPELPAFQHQALRRVVHCHHHDGGIGWHAHVRRRGERRQLAMMPRDVEA
jgi:hypothetical protein